MIRLTPLPPEPRAERSGQKAVWAPTASLHTIRFCLGPRLHYRFHLWVSSTKHRGNGVVQETLWGNKWMDAWRDGWTHFLVELVSVFPGSGGNRSLPWYTVAEVWMVPFHGQSGPTLAVFHQALPCPPATQKLGGSATQLHFRMQSSLGTCKATHSESSWTETKNPSLRILSSVKQVTDQIISSATLVQKVGNAT